MIATLPAFIPLLFGAIVVTSIIWFYLACQSRTFLAVVVIWTGLQSLLGYAGFFRDTASMPPRLILFAVLPALLSILLLFITQKGRNFLDGISIRKITWFHSIRVPVEIVLALLFHQGLISVYMTFEGANFDIFSGLTAPLVALFAFKKGIVKTKLLLAWNLLCLLLLINIVTIAALALPSPMQKIAFEQPNRAVMFFPFTLLPAVVVPLVLFAHLVAIRRLTIRNPKKS